MSKIKGKNTSPEMKLRRLLWNNGYRYRLHRKDLPGKPDLVFQGKKKVIFVHGCFWHKHDCKRSGLPKTNESYWKIKLDTNEKRDLKNQKDLASLGWKSLIVWQCEFKKSNIEALQRKVFQFLEMEKSLPSPCE